MLLEAEAVDAARPILQSLAEDGVAEAAYYLGIDCVQRGELTKALDWFLFAGKLNPDHRQTVEQIERIRSAIEGGD